MKNKLIFLLLFTMIIIQDSFASDGLKEGLLQSISGRRNSSQGLSALASKEIVVRVYNDWQSDSRTYQTISVQISGSSDDANSIKKAFPSIKDSAILAIVAGDQKDNDVTSSIKDYIYTEDYKAANDGIKRNLNLNVLLSGKVQGQSKLIVKDALGELVPNAAVEIFLKESIDSKSKIYIDKTTTDEHGQFSKPSVLGKLTTPSFTISHQNYGTAVIDGMTSDPNIILPFVHKDSQAYERSIRGVIVDTSGNPIEGATIRCTNVRTLGEGLINELGSGGMRVSVSDEKGTFSFYLPNQKTRDERGYFIPPKSKYQVRIEAPQQLSLVPYTLPVENSQPVAIVMEKGTFRTFVFEDNNGVITDPKKLQYLSITIFRTDRSGLSLAYNDFKDGGFFPFGEYKAASYGMDSFQFESLVVNESSPEELVFRRPQRILYYGQVINGLTGEPLIGVAIDASKVTSKTNEQGWFQITVVPNEFVEFIFSHENFCGFKHRCHITKPNSTGCVQLPVIKLYPAATALVEVHAETRISIWPRWIIEEKNNSSWVSDFLAADDRRDNMFTYDKWLEENKVTSLQIPAGINVRVKLDCPYDEKWCPIEIPQLLNVNQGGVVDLGSYTFQPAIEVSVEVRDLQGRTIEGVPVRKLMDNKVWGISHNTDEAGSARFYVVPNSEGQFGISYNGEGKNLKETIPYKINGRENTGRKFIFTISDQMMKYLFK